MDDIAFLMVAEITELGYKILQVWVDMLQWILYNAYEYTTWRINISEFVKTFQSTIWKANKRKWHNSYTT